MTLAFARVVTAIYTAHERWRRDPTALHKDDLDNVALDTRHPDIRRDYRQLLDADPDQAKARYEEAVRFLAQYRLGTEQDNPVDDPNFGQQET